MSGSADHRPLLEIKGLTIGFGGGEEVLAEVEFSLRAGEALGLVGESGSGKTTLLSVLGLLDMPTKGKYLLNGKDVTHLAPGFPPSKPAA